MFQPAHVSLIVKSNEPRKISMHKGLSLICGSGSTPSCSSQSRDSKSREPNATKNNDETIGDFGVLSTLKFSSSLRQSIQAIQPATNRQQPDPVNAMTTSVDPPVYDESDDDSR
ncbi:uncharacterized protein PHALS_11301 [Plasmopara halstedii]|uniref:Uncharacterized protein n=1 Tax=Plasmopara halstedii TaxID=4781 RepID=A0A0P1AJS4_PLAHL|nr:uncharacterized protein PHALS_11301 [Plasmopara halstedii]CEG41136.1 hypothetical protein PHALS_11301 [Plasmopara halstedii]|eukprot:XP_024577505.1 hypothetical protein PHALS_11301 [Plasmopara halstedii]